MDTNLSTTVTALSILALSQGQPALPASDHLLATHQMSLENRYEDKWVNNIFKENILLNLAYLRGDMADKSKINWDEVKKPFTYEFKLDPAQTFAYHEDVLDKYQGKVALTTNAHFNFNDGFKTDGYLYGDGVCHLASLLYWVAKDANLEAEAPTNHDFANIPDVPKEMGVSIYNTPYTSGSNKQQNLYITNNHLKPVTFKFEYENNTIKVSAVEAN